MTALTPLMAESVVKNDTLPPKQQIEIKIIDGDTLYCLHNKQIRQIDFKLQELDYFKALTAKQEAAISRSDTAMVKNLELVAVITKRAEIAEKKANRRRFWVRFWSSVAGALAVGLLVAIIL